MRKLLTEKQIEMVLNAYPASVLYYGKIDENREAYWYDTDMKRIALVNVGYDWKVWEICKKEHIFEIDRVYRILDGKVEEEDGKSFFFGL